MDGPQGPGDFEALARQYWRSWGDLLRTGVPGSGASAAGFAQGAAQQAAQGVRRRGTTRSIGGRSSRTASVPK